MARNNTLSAAWTKRKGSQRTKSANSLLSQEGAGRGGSTVSEGKSKGKVAAGAR